MMKKLLYGVAMAFVALLTIGSLQSCKDDLADLRSQTEFDVANLQANLQAQIDRNKAAVGDSIKALRDSLRNHRFSINANTDSIKNILGYLKKYATYEYVDTTLDKAKEALLKADTVMFDTLASRINGALGLIKANELQIKKNTDSIALIDRLLNQRVDSLRDSVNNRFDVLQTLVDNGFISVNGRIDDLIDRVDADSVRISDLEGRVDTLALNTWNRIQELNGRVDAQAASINTLRDSVKTWIKRVNDMSDTVQGNYKNIQTLTTNLKNLTQSVDSLGGVVDSIGNSVNDLWIDFTSFKEEVGVIAGIVGRLVNQVDEIETALNALTVRVDYLITGIIVQGTDSPVFGNFSLPIGVQSNLLFNWFGYNDLQKLDFPSTNNVNNYSGEAVPVSSFALIDNNDKYTIGRGAYGDVNLGKLYLTINPINHMFDNVNLKLETSAGKPFVGNIENVKHSKTEITFGYTRAASVNGENGFYEADVIVPETQIGNAKIQIEDNLKSAAKDALKDPSKRTAIGLLKAVYGQVNNTLPAYAVRYDWTADGKDYAVFSNYAIAATTAKPLSYSFLYDKSVSKKLPTINPFKNFIYELGDNPNLKFDFSNNKLNIDSLHIELDPITITASVDAPTAKLEVTPGTIYVKNEKGVTIGTATPEPFKVEGLDGKDGLYNQIASNFQTAIDQLGNDVDGWTKGVAGQINDEVNKMITNIKTQFESMMGDISGKINKNIENFIEDLGGKADPYFNKLNKLVDLYNKAAGKINKVLEDPNHLLQVAMFYDQANSKIGLLSNDRIHPTTFTGKNGWIGLYASSYTAEIVAPAYKKYVAITDILDADGNSTHPSSDDLKALNAKGKYLNEVMNGETIRFGISASALDANKIYEIVYQGVDYHGRTSTQKFYIKVN